MPTAAMTPRPWGTSLGELFHVPVIRLLQYLALFLQRVNRNQTTYKANCEGEAGLHGLVTRAKQDLVDQLVNLECGTREAWHLKPPRDTSRPRPRRPRTLVQTRPR